MLGKIVSVVVVCAFLFPPAASAETDSCSPAAAGSLARKHNVAELRLKKGLRRLNSAAATRKRWCDLSAAELDEILTYARQSKEKLSQAREEWLRFTLGDEKGRIPADGLTRALEQRKALVRLTPSTQALLPSTPAGWTNVTGYVHPVGRINDLLIHPTSTSTMWAGTDGGGIWKTTNGGATWQVANDFLASLSVSAFAMRPGDPSTIYAATGAQGTHTNAGGAGIFKSTDGGTVWNQLGSTSPSTNADFNFVYDLAIDPVDSNTVIAATNGGAYITTNGGGIWTEIAAASTRARNVAIHPANSNLRVIAMDDGTVRIATDGVTYNPFTIATVTGSSHTRIALAPSNQSIMYALVNNSGATELYRSADGGASWGTPIPTDPGFIWSGHYLSYTGGLWIDPTNPNHIAVVEAWAAVTADASVATPTWEQSDYGWVDFHGVTSDPGYNGTSNKIVYFFDDGGLYRWTDVDTLDTAPPAYLAPNGITVTEVYTVAGRGGNLIFGAQDVASRFYRTDPPIDFTQKWRFAAGLGGHDGAATAADRTNSSILYGSTQFLGIHRSTNGGQNTGFICQGITDISCGGFSGNSSFIAPFVLDPNDQNRMLAGARSLWRSNDVASGAPPTWTAIKDTILPQPNSNITAIAVAPGNSDVIWVAHQNGQVWKTANGTQASPAWEQVTTVPVGSKLEILIDRTNSSRVYIGLSGFIANRLITTPDAGASWSAVAGLPSASVFALAQHPAVASWLYAGTAVGLFASPDGGATWSATNQGPANVQVRDLQWYSESGASAELLVATFGRGIWRATLSFLAAPTGLLAQAQSATEVALNWTAVAGASGYKVFRSSNLFSFAEIDATGTTSYVDDNATAGAAYLYMVRATDGSGESGNSNSDLATTVMFTNPTLVAGASVAAAAHITELRTAVNAVRTLASLGAAAFTDPGLAAGTEIRGAHVTELRGALDAARAALSLSALGYTDPAITTGVTPVRAAHVVDLRDGVK